MGLLTDFFLAPAHLVEEEALTEGPQGHYPTEQYKNVDQTKIGSLESILVGTNCEVAIQNLMKGQIGTPPEDGPWCFRLSVDLVNRLASLGDHEIKPAVLKWLATEEWEADGATREDADDFAEMLKSFRRLAQLSIADGMAMYLWISL